MEEKAKELAAIAASVAGHCQPCLRHHLAKARELAASDEEILSVIELARHISEMGDQQMKEFADGLTKGEERLPRKGRQSASRGDE